MLPRAVALTLTSLVVALCAAMLPTAASAKLASLAVAVNQSAGNAAGSTNSVGININFNQTAGDAVKDVYIILPPGLLLNEETDGGACLSVTTPTPACQIGSGTATVGGTATTPGTSVPLALYLVQAPGNTDLAGLELVAGSLQLPGYVSFYSSANVGIEPSFDVSDELTFSGLPASPGQISALDLDLTGLTLPTSCQPADVTVNADTEEVSASPTAVLQPYSATAPFTVTGCLALPFQPTDTAAISRDTGVTDANFEFTVDNPAGSANLQAMKLKLPPNLQLNPAMDPCFEGVPCTVGKVIASSPLFPASQLTGTLTLSGTLRAPTLGIDFPPPVNISLETIFSATELSLHSIPDIPMTSFEIDFTGNSFGAVWIGLCYKALFEAKFDPWSGGAVGIQKGEVGVGNCVSSKPSDPAITKPKASASLSGISAGAAILSIEAAKGHNAPGIASLAVSLPHGLSFNDSTPLTRPVLSLTGARLASAHLHRGVLVITFRGAAARSALALRAPLLVASSALAQRSISRAARSSHLIVQVKDSRGHVTKLTVPLVLS